MTHLHPASSSPGAATGGRFALAVHGGAGVITRASLSPAQEAAFREGIARALLAGHAVLADGGSSLDAVIAAVVVLEDDPLFNAGRGAVFTHEGDIELDASVMCGATGQAGAVAGVRTIRNPVLAARAVMTHSRHVLLAGEGAQRFAQQQGLAMVDPAYFRTEHRWQQLLAARARDQVSLDHDASAAAAPAGLGASSLALTAPEKFGTVGAVACDQAGNLAAATSTGGLTNKRWGRIGDSPVIGAGTWAENATAAVSGTGEGEFFMRGLVAADIAARMRYRDRDLPTALGETIDVQLTRRGGKGGVIAVDAQARVRFGFNTEGMYRGSIDGQGVAKVAIFDDDPTERE